MNKKLYDQILTRWGSNACLNQWLKPHSLCYRHQPNLQWLWRFHCVISRRLKWIFRRFYRWIKKMGNVLMSCYFSVLILAICKKCRLVLASGAPSSPCETKEDASPLQSQERNETSAHHLLHHRPLQKRMSLSKSNKQRQRSCQLLTHTDEIDSVIYYYHQNQRQDLELKQVSNGSFLGP